METLPNTTVWRPQLPIVQRRRENITPGVREDTQTERGILFELLADLTDEDGALAELEDLDNLYDFLSSDTD